jgi:pyridoxal phosphate enzyme (YggS family)
LGGAREARVSISENIAEVKQRIAEACRRAGRDPASVGLVAVSKTRTIEECREAVAAGHADLGENYAQELRDKAPAVPGARWHYIGPLQRNKVKYVVGTAVLLHSIDSPALLDEVATRAARLGVVQACLIQVNVAAEARKSGCAPAALPALVDAFAAHPSVRLDGLMVIPPLEGDPRPHFAASRTLAEQHHLATLSMGMSADYEAAIEEGATLVRVGTAIFGERA